MTACYGRLRPPPERHDSPRCPDVNAGNNPSAGKWDSAHTVLTTNCSNGARSEHCFRLAARRSSPKAEENLSTWPAHGHLPVLCQRRRLPKREKEIICKQPIAKQSFLAKEHADALPKTLLLSIFVTTQLNTIVMRNLTRKVFI